MVKTGNVTDGATIKAGGGWCSGTYPFGADRMATNSPEISPVRGAVPGWDAVRDIVAFPTAFTDSFVTGPAACLESSRAGRRAPESSMLWSHGIPSLRVDTTARVRLRGAFELDWPGSGMP